MLTEFKSTQIVRNFFSAIFILTVVASISFAQPGERLSSAAKSDFAKGEFNSCIKEYSALIATEPKNDGFYGERSRCYFLKGNNLTKSGEATAESDTEIRSGLADAEKALVLNPKNTAALNIRGLINIYRKDQRGAIADFSRVIELDPKSPKAYLNRAVSKSAVKDFEGAIADYTKVIAINPQFAAAYLDRGRTYSESGKKTEAISDFTNVIELEPKSAKGYIYRGSDYSLLNKRVEAFADYEKAVELDPNNGITFMMRGNLFYEQKDYAKALTDLNLAIKYDADEPCVKIYRGRIHLENNDFNEAAADFDNYNSHAHWQKGCVLKEFYKGELEAKRTNYFSAIDWYSKALITFKSRGLDTTMVANAINHANAAREKRTVPASGNSAVPSDSGAANNAQPATYQPSAADHSRAEVAYYSAMQQYRTARASYQDAVSKYNRNIAANANMQGMMSGTVARAQTQLGIMRSSLGNLLREHGSSLAPDKLADVRNLYASLPSSPF